MLERILWAAMRTSSNGHCCRERRIRAAWPVALCSLLLAAGCGDSLSSLGVIHRQIVEMILNPDFGRKGQSKEIEVHPEPEFLKRLSEEAFVNNITVGDGIGVLAFAWNTDVEPPLRLELNIGMNAEDGGRTLMVLIATPDGPFEGRGKFFVLPPDPSLVN